LDSRTKSILKTFSWRIIATCTTIAVAYFFIGDISVALNIGVVEFFGKMIIYYMHERVWSKY
tara:strand:+ start:3723 stop:3908 length:186 start_codon:yes stop_codon:yes gene_type:complete